MIGYLNGQLIAAYQEHALVNVGGVGYEVSLSNLSLGEIQGLIGQTLSLWIYTHVREDALQLFGFLNRQEKEFFLQLLKVNGIGPKSALTILGGAPLARIQEWIENSDAKSLSQLPKVGKKTAEQIVLSLKGKLVKIEESLHKKSKSTVPSGLQKISSALVNLGFKAIHVDEFIETVPEDTKVEDGVRMGLQKLSGQI